MKIPRISASSYSNTSPLIWSFLYGQNHGKVEVILDTAPARSAQLLAEDRVDAALVPVIAYQMIDGLRLVPGVCVGADQKVRSVCLVTAGKDLDNVRSVALDISSKTSVVLTRIIFREFLGLEPIFNDAEPDLARMLDAHDCALMIGDPSLQIDETKYKKFDIVETWRHFTGLGFVFAMWMTRGETCEIDFAAARDEGLLHLDDIAANYAAEIRLSREELIGYLSKNISYSPDESMQKGLDLYFELAAKHKLISRKKELVFCRAQNNPD